MHRRLFAATSLVAVLALSACGDDSPAASATSTTAAASTDTVAAAVDTVVEDTMVSETLVLDDTVVDDTMVDDTMVDDTVFADDIEAGAGAGTEFCNVNDELSETESPLDSTEEPDPAALEAYFTIAFPEMFGRFAAAAPAEMGDEVAVLATGIDSFTGVLADNEWDLTASFNDPKMRALMNDPAFEEAGNRVDLFCGLGS